MFIQFQIFASRRTNKKTNEDITSCHLFVQIESRRFEMWRMTFERQTMICFYFVFVFLEEIPFRTQGFSSGTHKTVRKISKQLPTMPTLYLTLRFWLECLCSHIGTMARRHSRFRFDGFLRISHIQFTILYSPKCSHYVRMCKWMCIQFRSWNQNYNFLGFASV